MKIMECQACEQPMLASRSTKKYCSEWCRRAVQRGLRGFQKPTPIPKTMAGEFWRQVPGWEGLYEVSDGGRVWSTRLQRILKPSSLNGGYHGVTFFLEGKAYPLRVHRLVLLAFTGPQAEGMVCCHNDGDPTNNHVSNLRWDTVSANSRDSVDHGTCRATSVTHCPRGHEYTADNTIIDMVKRSPGDRRPRRRCRECNRQQSAAWREARRAAS